MRLALFFGSSILFLVLLAVNLVLARRLVPLQPVLLSALLPEGDIAALRRLATLLLVVGAVFAAFLFGAAFAGQWDTILLWLNAESFGVTEEAFGRDVSFYVFTLPALEFFQSWGLAAAVVITIFTALSYAYSFGLRRFAVVVPRAVKVHLSLLLVAILGLVHLGLLAGPVWPGSVGTQSGAGRHLYRSARPPARPLYPHGDGIAGGAANRRQHLSQRPPIASPGPWRLAAGGDRGRQHIPGHLATDQRPAQRVREGTGLHSAEHGTSLATPMGWTTSSQTSSPASLSSAPRPSSATPTLSRTCGCGIIGRCAKPITSYRTLRPQYIFSDVDVDRYVINGEYRQVMLGARELSPARVAEESPGWINGRLKFTHGYGLAMSPVTEFSEEGRPNSVRQGPAGIGGAYGIEAADLLRGENRQLRHRQQQREGV